RLVLDLDDAESGAQLLDQVVLFVVERRAAEVADRERPICRVAGLRLLLPALLARADDALGDHLHRLIERQLLPARAVGTAILDLVFPQRALHVALRGLPLRTK